MNLSWTLHRLSAMSRREVGYRIRQYVRSGVQQLGLLEVRAPAPKTDDGATGWVGEFPSDFETSKYTHAADEILAGRFRVFALRPADLGFPPDWNRDPKTGVRAPLRYGKSLNYRDNSLVGDIKYLWEPSRHAELVTLAQAWRLTRRPEYATGCRVLIESWFDQCPHPLGVHWTSSLEHAVRVIHWSFAWRLLGGWNSALFQDARGERFRSRWVDGVYLHCHFIANHLSRFSSANNHLFGELVGLFIASLTWPYWSASGKWRDQAQAELEREALLQNGADGVNREQANWYHHEVADMMLIAGLAGRACNRDFSTEYWSRWRAMLDYLASVMDVGGNVPAYGDADDAILARLDPAADFDAYGALLAAGAVVFDDGALKLKARRLDDKTRWLLGREAGRFHTMNAAAGGLPRRRSFTEGGYYILGCDFETEHEIRIVADAGPLGYLSIAAHGHADALSFTLSAGGRELLIDPGTFAYHTQRRWRDYFRGVSAHNTVRLDGADQSVSGGAFLWRTHAQARVTEFVYEGATQRLVAEHDGYLRLPDPVRHRRTWRFDADKRELIVVDDIECAGPHQIEQFWHFAEHCAVERVEAEQGLLAARADNARLTLQLDPRLQFELVRGSETPPLGWISRRFDERAPTTSVRAWLSADAAVQLTTKLRVDVRC